MNSNCEYNKEEVDAKINSINDMILFVTDLIKKIYSIVTLEYFAQMLKDYLAKND